MCYIKSLVLFLKCLDHTVLKIILQHKVVRERHLVLEEVDDDASHDLNSLSLFFSFKLPGFSTLDDISPTLQHSFEGYVYC